MATILSTSELTVLKNEIKNSYSIKFKYPSKDLIYSLIKTKLIIGSTITDNFRTLTFKALNIQSLKQFQNTLVERNGTKRFSYESSLRMLLSLSKQLSYFLTKTNICFFKYNPKNVLVLDEEVFLYLSNDDLVKREDEDLLIMTPFLWEDYVSPELQSIISIPTKINYQTIFYSLGLLILDSVLENELSISQLLEITKDQTILINEMEKSIGATKLFYCLKRCLDKEVKNRKVLYI
jgi:hypothetical protein